MLALSRCSQTAQVPKQVIGTTGLVEKWDFCQTGAGEGQLSQQVQNQAEVFDICDPQRILFSKMEAEVWKGCVSLKKKQAEQETKLPLQVCQWEGEGRG